MYSPHAVLSPACHPMPPGLRVPEAGARPRHRPGQPVHRLPLDEWGNHQTFRLPRSGLLIQYTTAVVNGTQIRWRIPDVVVQPSLAEVLAGDDPVLRTALSFPI